MYDLYLSLCQRLALFMSYLCDLFFIIIIFIVTTIDYPHNLILRSSLNCTILRLQIPYTCSLPPPQITATFQSEAYLESSQTSAVKLCRRNIRRL